MITFARCGWIVAVLTLSAGVPGLHVKEINAATDRSLAADTLAGSHRREAAWRAVQ